MQEFSCFRLLWRPEPTLTITVMTDDDDGDVVVDGASHTHDVVLDEIAREREAATTRTNGHQWNVEERKERFRWNCRL